MSRQRGNVPGEYYHVFNRGAHRQTLFREKSDWEHFLFSILYLQSPHLFQNAHRIVRAYTPLLGFPVDDTDIEHVIAERFVELVAFCLMPNHFHLLVRETAEDGISRYMQRVGTAYAMYFNTKYETSGHLFQGPYKTVRVETDTQLLYLSAYIHRNPRELKAWRGKEFEYPWSSLQDFTEANRWGGLIVPDIVVGQFDITKDSNYADFVRTSTAKTIASELEGIL